jgi:hypothetical protein
LALSLLHLDRALDHWFVNIERGIRSGKRLGSSDCRFDFRSQNATAFDHWHLYCSALLEF